MLPDEGLVLGKHLPVQMIAKGVAEGTAAFGTDDRPRERPILGRKAPPRIERLLLGRKLSFGEVWRGGRIQLFFRHAGFNPGSRFTPVAEEAGPRLEAGVTVFALSGWVPSKFGVAGTTAADVASSLVRR